MSHDDPSTKNAMKKPPDRGERSFLRTGSSPSLARVRARWAAFALAAAVLLGGSRALADDEARFRIDSPVFAQIQEYSTWSGRVGGRVVGGAERRPVCDSLCEEPFYLAANKQYVITGQFLESPTFRVSNLTGDVTITVQPGSYARRTAGLITLIFGGRSIWYPGFLLLSFGGFGEGAVESRTGIGFMVAGGVSAIVGGVLLATSGTTIRLRQAGEGPVGSAAPVEPRYWMGEF